MKTILSKYAGFCYGVDNAIKIAEQALDEHSGQDIYPAPFSLLKNKKDEKEFLKKEKTDTQKQTKRCGVYMLGALVHNEDVVKKIKDQGIKLVNDIKKIPEKSLVILSAHGHSPQIYKEAKKRNLQVIDATCPMVAKVHNLGKMLADKGYFIIIIGDKDHGEVKAIYGQVKTCTDKVQIIENAEQAKKIKQLPKIGIVSQTTQSVEHFDKVVEILKTKTSELKIFNTICDATRFRQASAIEVAKKADLMIIIGSFHSANTKRLTNICSKITTAAAGSRNGGTKTYQVNSAKELKKEWFSGIKTVGISAGASTPDWIIEKVVGEIKKIK